MTFAEWQEFTRRVRDMADRISRAREDRGWALAASVGIPRNTCCLHNASIDTDYRGWCSGPDGHHRLKVAKQANWMVTTWCWEPYRLADRIIARAWERVQKRAQQVRNGSDYWMASEAHGVKCGEVLMLSDGYFPDGTPRPPRAAKVVWFSGPDKWPVVRYEDNQQTETISPNCVETARLVATH